MGAEGVEGERACEKLEFMLNLMASDSLQVPPPTPHPPLDLHQRRRDQQVGWAL